MQLLRMLPIVLLILLRMRGVSSLQSQQEVELLLGLLIIELVLRVSLVLRMVSTDWSQHALLKLTTISFVLSTLRDGLLVLHQSVSHCASSLCAALSFPLIKPSMVVPSVDCGWSCSLPHSCGTPPGGTMQKEVFRFSTLASIIRYWGVMMLNGDLKSTNNIFTCVLFYLCGWGLDAPCALEVSVDMVSPG